MQLHPLSPPATPPETVRPLLRHRTLLGNFYRRELRNRYVGSVSGQFWTFLHPLLLLGVYTFVFTVVFRPPELTGKHFLLFVAIGLWPWLAFQEALLRGTVAIQGHAGLIKKVAFPHELIVYASVAATFTLHAAGYVLVMVILGGMGQPLTPSGVPLAAGLWIILFVAACGAALFFSALQVFLKDTEHILNPVMQVLFFVAPILYPLSLVPKNLRPWVEANPMSYVVTRLRDALEGGLPWPSAGDLLAILFASAIFLLGRAFFRRLSPYFEDFV